MVLSKSKALLDSDVVNFILNMTRSGLGQLLTLIGYSSELTDMAESSRFKKCESLSHNNTRPLSIKYLFNFLHVSLYPLNSVHLAALGLLRQL